METSNILVSVVVPIYNDGKYLKKCLGSIVSQSYPNLEIIVIDDESTDQSSEILRVYKDIDSRMKIINKKRTSSEDCRTIGIKVSQGSYITFIDSHDNVEYDYIEKALSLAIKHKADIVQMAKRKVLVAEQTPINKQKHEKICEYNNFEGIESYNYNKHGMGTILGKLIRKNIFKIIEDSEICDSKVYYLTKAFILAEKTIETNHIGYNSLMHENGIMARKFKSNRVNALDEAINRMQQLESKDKAHFNSCISNLIRVCMEIVFANCNEEIEGDASQREKALEIIAKYKSIYLFDIKNSLKDKMTLLKMKTSC